MDRKVILLILDGWGLSASFAGNAIKLSNAENFNYLWNSYPHWVLNVKPRERRNDYVIDSNNGLATLSCGRFLPSNLEFIDKKIEDKTFFSNKILNNSMDKCLLYKSSLHLVGLISGSKKYSSLDHLIALMEMAKNKRLDEVFIHVICDGIDSQGESSEIYINKIKEFIDKENIGKIASIAGRKYCFDDEASFENIIKSFKAIIAGEANRSLDVIQTIRENREQNHSDDKLYPTAIYENKHPVGRVKDFDSIIFFNFDKKSLRSLSSIFLGQRHAIRNKEVYNVNVTTFTDYFYLTENNQLNIAFLRDDYKPNLAQILSENNKKQLFISDIEKSGSAVYSFCGQKDLLLGQTNKIINTESNQKNLSDYIFSELIRSINDKDNDFICANVSAADYIAHRENINETENAVRNIDLNLLEIEEKTLKNGYHLIITADHGFIEQLANRDSNYATIKNHSNNPVPFIYISQGCEKKAFNFGINNNLLSEILNANNTICDVAPTILKMFGIDKLDLMVGNSLLGGIKQ